MISGIHSQQLHCDQLVDNLALGFQDGWTPLHVAVQARRSDIVKLLLIKGADVQVKNKASSLIFPLISYLVLKASTNDAIFDYARMS